MLAPSAPRHVRTLFISDVHLGCKGCQAGLLLDFLRYHDAETIYLVGDIVDGWRLKRGWYWPQEHNDVVQKLLRKGRKGSRIVYVPAYVSGIFMLRSLVWLVAIASLGLMALPLV